MTGLLTKLLEPLLPPGLRGDHNHGHDGPDGLLGLGHEGDGHGHGIDQGNGPPSGRADVAMGHEGDGHGDHSDFGNGPAYGRNDGGQSRSADIPAPPVPGSSPGSSPGASGAQGNAALPAPPGFGSGVPGLPGGLPILGNPLGSLSPSASPSVPSSPLSTVLDFPLAQLASLTSGLQTVVQQALGGSQSSTPETTQTARTDTVVPRALDTVVPSGQNAASLPGQLGVTGDRSGAVPLTQPGNVVLNQTPAQGVPAAPPNQTPVSTASVPLSQAATTAVPAGSTQLASSATTLPEQVASLPPGTGRLDTTTTANAQLARNDVAFLAGNNALPAGSTQLTQSPASVVQARGDVVPAAVAPQIAGSTIVPGAQLTQPGQLQSGFVRPGLDGTPIAAKEGLAGPLAGHTAEGVRRRGYSLAGRRLPGILSWLAPSQSLPLDHPLADDPDLRAAERAYTWLFWVLGIVGYASLAFAIVALVPPGSSGLFDDSGTRLTGGGFALFAGVMAVVGAWWLVRKSQKRPA